MKSDLFEEIAELKRLQRIVEQLSTVQTLIDEAHKLAQNDFDLTKSYDAMSNEAKIYCLLDLANKYLESLIVEN